MPPHVASHDREDLVEGVVVGGFTRGLGQRDGHRLAVEHAELVAKLPDWRGLPLSAQRMHIVAHPQPRRQFGHSQLDEDKKMNDPSLINENEASKQWDAEARINNPVHLGIYEGFTLVFTRPRDVDQYAAVRKLDEGFVGTSKYMGVAHFLGSKAEACDAAGTHNGARHCAFSIFGEWCRV